MLEASLYRTPFSGMTSGDHPTRSGAIGVRLSAQRCASVMLLGTWVGNGAALQEAMTQAIGASAPARTGTCHSGPMGLLIRIGPEEFLLVGEAAAPQQVSALRQQVTPEIGSVTDLSHARCRIRMDGERCLDTLAKLFALDLREKTFPMHEARLSGHHHVPCLLHRRGVHSFDLYVLSTYARDQLETLKDAALEFGVSLDCVA